MLEIQIKKKNMENLISLRTDERNCFKNRFLNRYIFLIFLIIVNYTVFTQKMSKSDIINGLYSGKFQFTNLDSKWKKDIDVAFNAVYIDGLNLKYVNSKFKNSNDFVQAAIWNNGYSINYIDKNKFKNIDSVRDIFDDSEVDLILNKYVKKYTDSKNWLPKSIFRKMSYSGLEELNILMKDLFITYKEPTNLFPSQEEILKDSSTILYSFKILPYEFQKDTNIIFNVLEKDAQVYGLLEKNLQDELLSNRNLILKGLKRNYNVLYYVDSNLKSDRNFILSAVQMAGKSLVFLDEGLKGDKKIVLEAVKTSGQALEYASEELKNDKDVVLEAVKSDGYALKYASEELKKNKSFIIEAIKICRYPNTLLIDDSLKDDEEIKKLLNNQ